MWILPKQLISAFVPGTEVLTLDSSEASKACEQSLMRRSKPSLAKCYSREWKAGNLMRLRSGVISSHSLGQSFEDWWTSLLEDTRASHSVEQDSDLVKTTQGTCGHSSQMELGLCVQEHASLKTSKDTSRWDSPQSSVTWKKWVTMCRGEYSQRVNAVLHTYEKEFSFLPTPCANEDSFRLNGNSQQSNTLEARARRGELKTIGSAMDVDTLSFAGANAIMVNLNVLNATNGHTHSTGSQKMDVRTAEILGRNGTTSQPGPLNPQFVEAMMGLPIGWTDCDS